MVKHAAARAWTAAALPPLVLAVLQQGWGQLARQGCGVARSGGLTGGFIAVAVLGVAAVLAWSARRATDTSRFVAMIALGETVLFGLALAFHLIAGFVIPPCWR